MSLFKSLPYAQLSAENGSPYSTEFEDIYFNPEHSIAETEYVFLQGNQLIELWQANPDRQAPWIIGETGFGTGLNFFVIADSFLKNAAAHQSLNYISTEKHPIDPATLKIIHSYWPQFSEFSTQLLMQHPPAIEGSYRLNFFNHRIQLTLLLSDATEQLNSLLRHPKKIAEPITMDAWVLDGFAPAKNPQLWNTELFSVIGRLSKPGTRFATFTAAGIVKEGLSAVGFKIEKRKGFGRKRDCLAGEFIGIEEKENRPYKLADSPWFIKNTFQPKDKTVSIIGGGLAGTACAYSLAQRGWQVHLYERENDLAQITSGNPAGILSVQLSPHNNPHNRFYQSSYYYAINQLKKLLPEKNTQWDWCGVLQLAFNEKELKEHALLIAQKLWPENWLYAVSAEQARELSGIICHTGGLFFPNAGWVQPYALCKIRCQHPNIHLHFSQSVEELIFEDNAWHLLNEKNEIINRTSAVVIANAFDALKFSQTNYLPLRPMRGQVSFVPSNAESMQLKTVLSYEGYATPAHNNWHSVGATFSSNDTDLDLREQDHQSNMNVLQKNFPEFYQKLLNNSVGAQFIAPSSDAKNTIVRNKLRPYKTNENLNKASKPMMPGRAGIRCQTPDYLPIAGPAPKKDFFITHYDAVRTGNIYQPLPKGNYWSGLYVSLGHGSRGLTTTDFCAEIIASELNGEFFPTDTAVAQAIHPARFLIRALKRRLI